MGYSPLYGTPSISAMGQARLFPLKFSGQRCWKLTNMRPVRMPQIWCCQRPWRLRGVSRNVVVENVGMVVSFFEIGDVEIDKDSSWKLKTGEKSVEKWEFKGTNLSFFWFWRLLNFGGGVYTPKSGLGIPGWSLRLIWRQPDSSSSAISGWFKFPNLTKISWLPWWSSPSLFV